MPDWWSVFWEWFWTNDHGFWLIMGLAGIRFLIKDVPKIIYMWKTTPSYGDDDPSGNDNIRRRPYDYM
jgi:hypothetical protein